MNPQNDFDAHDTDYTDRQTFKPGDRVELHPGCDLWMRGAKYGTVVRVFAPMNEVRVAIDANETTYRFPFDRLRHAR